MTQPYFITSDLRIKKPSILVIDDDDIIISVVEATLNKNDFSVTVARNGKDGLNILNTLAPQGIILDKKMPNMGGDEVLKKLKSNKDTKNIPVLILTSQNERDGVLKCLEMGACDYILKPFDQDNLLVRVHNMLRRSIDYSFHKNPAHF